MMLSDTYERVQERREVEVEVEGGQRINYQNLCMYLECVREREREREKGSYYSTSCNLEHG
jgi:hypothetical protein